MQVGNYDQVVAGSIRSQFWVGNLKINKAIHSQLSVIARDTGLTRDIQRDLFQHMLVSNTVNKWNDDIQTGVEFRYSNLTITLDGV